MFDQRSSSIPRVLRGRARLALVNVAQSTAAIPSRPLRDHGVTERARRIQLPTPPGWQRSRVDRVDLMVLIDDSGSMYGMQGDPLGVRRAAALSVVALLAKGSDSRRGAARVGVVHFGSSAPLELALPLTDVRERRIVERAMHLPPPLGGTNVGAALARVHDLLSAEVRRLPIVVVVTDGIEAVGAEVARELSRLPMGAVHVVLVDHSGGCDAVLEACWRSLSLGSFERLNVLDVAQMAWQIANVVTRAVGLSLPPLNFRQSNPPPRR